MNAETWEAAWSAARRDERRRPREWQGTGRALPAGALVSMPSGLSEEQEREYTVKKRSVMALAGSEEIAARYPFAAAIGYLKERQCRFGELFGSGGNDTEGNGNGNGGCMDAALLESVRRYVMASMKYGHGEEGGTAVAWRPRGRGGDAAGMGGNDGMSKPHANAQRVEIGGVVYCGEAVTHALALMVAHMCGPRAAAKFAMGHAQWAVANMRRDAAGMSGLGGGLPGRFVRDYIWCLMPFEAEDGSTGTGGEAYSIAISAYLARSVHIADPAWKLVNRRVRNGRVLIGIRELLRLARHDIYQKILRDVEATRVDRPAARAVEYVVRRVSMDVRVDREAAREGAATAGANGRPPCVVAAIDSLDRAENLPHHGRLLVAAYTIREGVDEKDVVSLFVNAPDYSEKVTSAQVAHIAANGYMPQSCEKLESLGLCRRTAACGKIRNPVQFGMTGAAASSPGKKG